MAERDTGASNRRTATTPAVPSRDAGQESDDEPRIEMHDDDPLDCYAGCLDTGGDLHKRVRELHQEWA
jgi:hypothetical protein